MQRNSLTDLSGAPRQPTGEKTSSGLVQPTYCPCVCGLLTKNLKPFGHEQEQGTDFPLLLMQPGNAVAAGIMRTEVASRRNVPS